MQFLKCAKICKNLPHAIRREGVSSSLHLFQIKQNSCKKTLLFRHFLQVVTFTRNTVYPEIILKFRFLNKNILIQKRSKNVISLHSVNYFYPKVHKFRSWNKIYLQFEPKPLPEINFLQPLSPHFSICARKNDVINYTLIS